MPGSGKSHFGKTLESKIGGLLIDLDTEIEQHEGKEIASIFSEKGEPYFRQLESDLLHQVSKTHPNAIISTGGGTPCFHEGISFMNDHGITVFLDTEKELLINRLEQDTNRPLIHGDTERRVDELLKSRLPVYKKAHITISHRDVDFLINQINLIRN